MTEKYQTQNVSSAEWEIIAHSDTKRRYAPGEGQ